MSRLDELIAELCPDGVEYKKLGDLCSIKARIGWQRLTKSEYLTEGNYYLITGVDITSGYRVNFESCYYVSEERYHMDENIQLQNGDIIVTKDGTIGKVALIEHMDKPGVLNSHLFVIRDKSGLLENKYLMYILLSNVFQKFVSTNQTQGTIPGLNQATIVKFTFPVPPLPVQQEIVRILDHFTELTAELQKQLDVELTARKKQYEYYRDFLLSFDETVPIKRIGELSNYRRGSFPQPYGHKEWYDGDGAMPFVQVADIGDDMRLVNDTKRKISVVAQKKSVYAPKGSVVISLQGSIGRIAITQYDAYIDRTVAIFHHLSEQVNKKYFVYELQRVFSIKEKTARGSTIKTITKEEFTDFSIPVPSIIEQGRIVSILDRFDSLCNDLSSDLPAEIAARQKQYEYYRDKLLTFKEKKVQ